MDFARERFLTALWHPLQVLYKILLLMLKQKFTRLLRGQRKTLIVAIHLPPLLGYPGFPGLRNARINALRDLRAAERGGADAIIFENNYDLPHREKVGPGSLGCLLEIGRELRRATRLPLGISVLWNDYEAALVLAKLLNLQFIRVPALVDTVKTDWGIIRGAGRQVSKLKTILGADRVAICADIHVKHAQLLSRHSLLESARLAIRAGADALILTGRWTGDPPKLEDLQKLRFKIGDFPILAGSGITTVNSSSLGRYLNGAIVSTSLKKGRSRPGERNIKPYECRLDLNKIRKLARVFSGRETRK
ncbi:MAG: BtpA/SgcQ family protein [Candidatus Liptonbacteria bacterium]|nr:BtpA/SgcQ family protein [Candidatus Liptonbacteria bacterium]